MVCHFDPNCSFTPNLDRTNAGVIRAADGSLLNGGTQDYWKTFVAIGAMQNEVNCYITEHRSRREKLATDFADFILQLVSPFT
jgi:hypothetical protein